MKLKTYEEDIHKKKFDEFLVQELNNLKEEDSKKLIDIYLSRKYGGKNPFENRFKELFIYDWELLDDFDKKNLETLGWSESYWSNRLNEKPKIHNKEWSQLKLSRKNSCIKSRIHL